MIKRIIRLKNILIGIIAAAVVFSHAICHADAEKIFRENNKAVVFIVTYDKDNKPIATGSGFIVRSDGAVVTNYHVISDAVKIVVAIGDKVIGVDGVLHADKENDIVILKIKAKGLPTVKMGDIKRVNIGEKVYVIGSPKGLENTISDGILSGIRDMTLNQKVLQFTAPISSGSSGGPLFNKNGEAIGIVTLLLEDSQNINFAMPINLVKNKVLTKKIMTLEDAVIENYKKFPEYWYFLGNYQDMNNHYQEAIDAYKQAIRIKPDYSDAYNDLGNAYGKSKRYQEAMEALKQAIKIKPDHALAYYNLGVYYDILGRYQEAMETNKQAIRIKPDYAEAHVNLGHAYNNLGRYQEAIEALKQAIRINPDLAMAYVNLGSAYGKLGRYQETIETFKQAIRINPDLAMAYYGLGITYYNLGTYQESINAYKQAIRINPDYADANNNLGNAYGRSGRYQEAIEAYKRAIKIKPDDAMAHNNLGVAHLNLGDRGSALEEYKILKDIDSNMADKLFNLIYK